MQKISFIGAGNMAESLARAILDSGITKEIIMSDKKPKKLKFLKQKLKVKVTQNNNEVVENSDIIFLCVKPQDISGVLDEIAGKIKNQLIVSIAAGIRLSYLEAKLRKARVIRAMPNIACLVGEMAGGFSLGKYATKKDAETIKKLLDSSGKSFLLDEKYLDIVTALSGSGPAFIAYFLSAMISAGVKHGLTNEQATMLAVQTAYGTAKLLLDKKISPDELVKMVASKGGTTSAGLKVFEDENFKEIVIKAIGNAKERSREMGR